MDLKRALLDKILFLPLVLVGLSVTAQEPTPLAEPPVTPVMAELQPEHSVARAWNKMLLVAIRNDLARPTVHARNLFHSSALMYDLWASFDAEANTYLLGKTLNGFTCEPANLEGERSDAKLREAISYGMYRLLKHRFSDVPDVSAGLDVFMGDLGYVSALEPSESSSAAAALGLSAANCYITYGEQDGSNENVFYANEYYWPVNEGLDPWVPGNKTLRDPNRWQPLIFEGGFVDQSGNLFDTAGPIEFLGAEWGQVKPFALNQEDLKRFERDNTEYWVYHDPGPPPYLNENEATDEAYLWNFFTVAAFSAQLDPASGVTLDISPASLGNLSFEALPETRAEFEAFYSLEGGMMGTGYEANPVTGEAYEPQPVPLGDYTRVLAEYWADGPHSETPPGHWFTILNDVSDRADFERRFAGRGEPLGKLEWDVKAYFTLGGAMHDAAVASWGIKGWYDYPRPVSVIRYLAEQGQSSDPALPNYSVRGLPLVEGLSELIEAGDPLAGKDGEHIGKVKLFSWRGPNFVVDPERDTAGVGWILGEHWWPYQRPSFITPPFAGYVSGHSTFSRAAAEVLTKLTGSPYFPDGLGGFRAEKNAFLVFEEGPVLGNSRR